MTDKKELERLTTKMKGMRFDVTINEDSDGWIDSITINDHTYPPIAAAEKMRSIVAAREENSVTYPRVEMVGHKLAVVA